MARGHRPARLFSTDRISSQSTLDPAIKRRAAYILTFKRPDKNQRKAVLTAPLKELGLSEKDIEEISKLTGPKQGRDYGFTFSDLLQRLIPTIILDAYPINAVFGKRAIDIALHMIPTSPFKET